MNKITLTRVGALACAAWLALSISACSAGPAAPSSAPVAPSTSTSTATAAQRIESAIGTAACDNPGQCRTLAVGSKACGGPERYLAYSTKQTDVAQLQALAAEVAAQRRAEDAQAGRMSTCSVTPDPGATCQAGRCVLQPRGVGDALAR